MKNEPLSPDVYPLVLSDYQAGVDVAEIVRRYGVSKGSVANIVRRMGGTLRGAHNKKLSEQKRLEIVERYRNGETTTVLSEAFGVSVETVCAYVREQGIEVRLPGGFTRARVKEMADLYASGMDSYAVAERFGTYAPSVLLAARKHGVPIRKSEDYPSACRRYEFNEDFFARWSPDMAYVLGFCFADACVDRDLYTLRIYQKETEILEQIRQVIGFSGPYRKTGTGGSIHALVLSSVKLVRDVVALGLVPAKSLIARVPDEVPYPADFVRGNFDGDGYGGWYKKRRTHVLRIGFSSGSIVFLEGLKVLLPCKIGGPYQGKGNYGCLLSGNTRDSLILRDWMYSGQSSLYVSRKRDKLFAQP